MPLLWRRGAPAVVALCAVIGCVLALGGCSKCDVPNLAPNQAAPHSCHGRGPRRNRASVLSRWPEPPALQARPHHARIALATQKDFMGESGMSGRCVAGRCFAGRCIAGLAGIVAAMNFAGPTARAESADQLYAKAKEKRPWSLQRRAGPPTSAWRRISSSAIPASRFGDGRLLQRARPQDRRPVGGEKACRRYGHFPDRAGFCRLEKGGRAAAVQA